MKHYPWSSTPALIAEFFGKPMQKTIKTQCGRSVRFADSALEGITCPDCRRKLEEEMRAVETFRSIPHMDQNLLDQAIQSYKKALS